MCCWVLEVLSDLLNCSSTLEGYPTAPKTMLKHLQNLREYSVDGLRKTNPEP